MASRRTRRGATGAFESLGAVLGRTDEARRARPDPIPLALWHSVVGERIAARTRPFALERRVLVVRVATAVWAQELGFLAPTIVERLRARGVNVDSLRLRVGPVDPPSRDEPPPPMKKPVPRRAALPAEVASALGEIGDAELAEVIARAASANLAWQDVQERTVVTRGAKVPEIVEPVRSESPERTRPFVRGRPPPRGIRRH